jgi:hypothetical protein
MSISAGEVSLSNRRETASVTEAVLVRTGVDRLSLSFPAEQWNPDPTGWDSVTIGRAGTPQEFTRRGTTVRSEDGRRQVFVGVSDVQGQPVEWAKVEFNPSRIVDPDGHSLAMVEDLAPALDVALGLAEDRVRWSCKVGEMRVKRIDLARDFSGVERPAYTIRGLGPVRRPWARRNLVHFDPSRSGAQTLMVGSGSGVVRLYDKWAETKGAAPEGTVRWEVEARDGWCNRYGEIRTMADVDDDGLERFAKDRWDWSAMGSEVSATERVVEQVMRSGLSYREQRQYLGHLMMMAAGVEVPAGTEAMAKWNRLTRKLGIVLGEETFASSGGFSSRLDWDSGSEVVSCG